MRKPQLLNEANNVVAAVVQQAKRKDGDPSKSVYARSGHYIKTLMLPPGQPAAIEALIQITESKDSILSWLDYWASEWLRRGKAEQFQDVKLDCFELSHIFAEGYKTVSGKDWDRITEIPTKSETVKYPWMGETTRVSKGLVQSPDFDSLRAKACPGFGSLYDKKVQ